MGLGDFLFGSKAQKYVRNPNDASMGGAYGATQNLQNAAGGALGHAAPVSQAANAGGAQQGQASSLDTNNYNQVRGGQMGLAGMLTQAANGQGPSGAGMAAQAQRDAALSQASALQAGRRGQSAAAGAKMGSLGSQMGVQQAAQNEAIGRANEMATARGQLGNVYGQVAGQDIGVAGQNAGFGQQMSMFNAGQRQNMNQYNASNQQQTNLANQNANLQQQGLNNSLFLGANQGLLGQSQAEMGARLHQGDLEYSNLQPGSPGFFQSLGDEMGPAGIGMQTYGAIGSAFARGGFITKPTVALVGEAGPEMVVPLSKGHEEMQNAARHILAAIPDNGNKDSTLQPRNGEVGMHLADGGVIGAGQRERPDWYVGTPQGYAPAIGADLGKLISAYLGAVASPSGSSASNMGKLSSIFSAAGGGAGGAGAGGAAAVPPVPMANGALVLGRR